MLRSAAFMERYVAHLAAREGKLDQLRRQWQREAICAAAAADPGARERAELRKLAKDLAKCGWALGLDAADAANAEAVATDDRVEALLQRARDLQAARESGSEAPSRGGDGLEDLQQQWAARQAASSNPVAQQQQQQQQQRGASALARPSSAPTGGAAARGSLGGSHRSAKPGSGGTAAVSTGSGGTTGASTNGSGSSHLQAVVSLLAGATRQQLEAIGASQGTKRLQLLFRCLRMQRFLAFTAGDLAWREARLAAAVDASFRPRRRVITRQQADEFLQRLAADALKRQASRDGAARLAAMQEEAAAAGRRRAAAAPGVRPRSARH